MSTKSMVPDKNTSIKGVRISVVDPDPYVFGLIVFGSFHQQAKKVRKTLISTFCDFFLTFYL
jgi:hypothetical protein